ncbi:MAG: M50 family metallopeptidase [Myxococcales bacterium]
MAARLPTRLLAVLALSFVAGIFFWHTWPLYPFKLLVVLMHESGHAAAALLVGGSVQRIVVDPREGGYTLSLLPTSLWSQIVVASAGYVGSTISGCVLLLLAARSKTGRWPLVALAAWTAAVAALWVRDSFTLLFVAGASLVLALVARFGPSLLRRGLLVFLGTFSVSYALYDIRDDLLHFASSGAQSDADALAQATLVPAIVWGIAWGLVSVVVVALTLRFVLGSRTPGSRPAPAFPRRSAV